jgi:transposase
MIDTSIVRVHQHGACITRYQRQLMGRSRGGLTSKIHAVVDGNGLPTRLALSPGEAHDVRLGGKLLSRLKSGPMLLADRGYGADWIRELAMNKGAWANIPPKSNRSDPICSTSCNILGGCLRRLSRRAQDRLGRARVTTRQALKEIAHLRLRLDGLLVSQYLPILVHAKGRPGQATYIGQGLG